MVTQRGVGWGKVSYRVEGRRVREKEGWGIRWMLGKWV